MRWGLLGLIIWFIAGEACDLSYASSSTRLDEEDYYPRNHTYKKKKPHKHKKHKIQKHKSKKHKSNKHKPKEKIYSAEKIDKILKNDQKDTVCNRLNCASNLETAKSCLKDKASHRKNAKCFRAFCAYGCNDEDYATKPDVYDFCNLTCSSKKYLRNKKRPEVLGVQNEMLVSR